MRAIDMIAKKRDGGILTAQEFEFGTILEYRLAPAPVTLVLGARLARLILTAFIAVGTRKGTLFVPEKLAFQ